MQAKLEPLLEGIGLLVLDNLSSLTTVIRDNDAESWNPIQEWLLRLRRRGILNDKAIWTTREIDDVNLARVKALHEDGLTVREIADETGIPKSTVQRLKKKIEADAAVG